MEEFFFGTEPIRWVQELFGLGRPLAFRIFSLLGDTWGMLLVAGVALWVFGRRTFHAVVGIVVAGAATKLLLSRVFHQERPRGAEIVVYERLEVSSFPSGHVYAAVGPWGLLWALGCVPLWVPALLAVLVSLGRLYLGTHFVGDVVAGIGFGAVLVWAYHRALPHLGRWLAARPRRFWIAAAAVGFLAALGSMLIAGGNPRRYEIYGILIAASVALPLESRLFPGQPAPASRASVLLRVVLGTAGIALFLLWDRSRSDQALLLGTFTAGLATLWVVLGAPALFRTRTRGTRMDRTAVARGLKRTGLAVGAVLATLLVWGTLVEPRVVDAEEHTAWVPRLPPAWEDARIAVVADYQVGMWGANIGTMRRATRHLVETRPAAVLIAGDFVYKTGGDPAEEIARVVEIVRPLAAGGIPTFAVLGNHDFGLNEKEDAKQEAVAAEVRASLERAGIRVLHNEAVVLPDPPGAAEGSGRLHLVGIGSEWADEARPEEALDGVPAGAARVVFMHNPDTFRRIRAGEAPFAVAAHTHGGQVRIPGTPDWSWLQLVVKGNPTADGWIEDGYGRPGNRLYVNRGLGFSTIPVRINAPPEITYFRLRSAGVRTSR